MFIAGQGNSLFPVKPALQKGYQNSAPGELLVQIVPQGHSIGTLSTSTKLVPCTCLLRDVGKCKRSIAQIKPLFLQILYKTHLVMLRDSPLICPISDLPFRVCLYLVKTFSH